MLNGLVSFWVLFKPLVLNTQAFLEDTFVHFLAQLPTQSQDASQAVFPPSEPHNWSFLPTATLFKKKTLFINSKELF